MARHVDPLSQLKLLNELFGRKARSDEARVAHAHRAIEFFAREAGEVPPRAPFMNPAIDRLASIHFGAGAEQGVAFAHCELAAYEAFAPLWARRAIVDTLLTLSGKQEAFLLVTGLREAVCPSGGRWTASRRRRYRTLRDWIGELACAWSSRQSQLQIVIL